MNIVISGASKGIGYAIAEVFAAQGNTLFICARNAAPLAAAAKVLEQAYPQSAIHTYTADLSVAAEAVAFGEWVLSAAGHADVLVNNAGYFLPGSIHNEPAGTLEAMLAGNLYSAYHLTRTLVPSMIKQNSGHIFTMCSVASLHAYANGGSYSISKFALAGFSKNLREELKSHNIKVTAVYPGAVYTASWEGSGVAAERIMEAADVAKMVLAASQLSPQAVIEDIVLRPQLGDL